jgi:hypothetical protein
MNQQLNWSRCSAFTLIELLVVLAIQKVREAANRMSCNVTSLQALSTRAGGEVIEVPSSARNAYNIDPTYQGSVSFATSDPDPSVVLPADYTFTTGDVGDNGVHTFAAALTLLSLGDQTLTVTDKGSGRAGRASVTVGPGP